MEMFVKLVCHKTNKKRHQNKPDVIFVMSKDRNRYRSRHLLLNEYQEPDNLSRVGDSLIIRETILMSTQPEKKTIVFYSFVT